MGQVLMFDFDGVIVDSLEVFRQSFTDTCGRLGLVQFESEVDFLDLFETNFYEGVLGAGFPAAQMGELNKGMEEALVAANKKLAMFAGAGEVLGELAARHTVVIITSSISRAVEEYLRAHNIDGVKEVLGAEKETSKVKKIRQTMAKYPDGTYYYIGDTKGDIREGQEAGVQMIGAAWGWHGAARLREAQPDWLVHSPAELLGMFQE